MIVQTVVKLQQIKIDIQEVLENSKKNSMGFLYEGEHFIAEGYETGLEMILGWVDIHIMGTTRHPKPLVVGAEGVTVSLINDVAFGRPFNYIETIKACDTFQEAVMLIKNRHHEKASIEYHDWNNAVIIASVVDVNKEVTYYSIGV